MTALPSFMTSGAWWDASTGVSTGSAWVDGLAAASLGAYGSPVVVPNVLNGKPVVRYNQLWNGGSENQAHGTNLAPLGVDPVSYSLFVLARMSPGLAHTTQYIASLTAASSAEIGYTDLEVFWDASGPPIGWRSLYESYENSGSNQVYAYSDEAIDADEFYLFETVKTDGSTFSIRANGVELPIHPDSAFPVESYNWGRFSIANYTYASGGIYYTNNGFVGDVALVVAAPFTVTPENRAELYQWVRDEYGLLLPGTSGGESVSPAVGGRHAKTFYRMKGSKMKLPRGKWER